MKKLLTKGRYLLNQVYKSWKNQPLTQNKCKFYQEIIMDLFDLVTVQEFSEKIPSVSRTNPTQWVNV